MIWINFLVIYKPIIFSILMILLNKTLFFKLLKNLVILKIINIWNLMMLKLNKINIDYPLNLLNKNVLKEITNLIIPWLCYIMTLILI